MASSKVHILMLALSLAAAAPLAPQARKTAQASTAAREQDTLKEIKRLEDELRIAMVKGDATWWNVYLSSEYSETDANGKVRNKAETMEMHQSKTLIYETLDFSDRTVRTFNGDTVIVTGRMAAQGTDQGRAFNTDYQVTRVWVKQGLEWKLASLQETKVAK